MPSRAAVLLTPLESLHSPPLPFYKHPAPISPLFATLRSRPQITENTDTLSPFLAAHTDFSPVSPVFATHTKTAGVYTNNSHSGTHPLLSFLRLLLLAPSQLLALRAISGHNGTRRRL